MFWSKRKEPVPKPSGEQRAATAFDRYKSEVLSVIPYVNRLYIAAVGDDSGGNSVHVTGWARDGQPFDVGWWTERVHRKVARLSFVRIEASGHDSDGDYRSVELMLHDREAEKLVEILAELNVMWEILSPNIQIVA